MKKMTCCIALCLALMLALPFGALARESTEGLLATINGTPISIDKAYAEYENYSYLYRMYGLPEEAIESLKGEIARYFVDMFLMEAEFQRLELSVDEEAVNLQAEQTYEATLNECLQYVSEEGKTEQENLETARDYLSSQGYTLESVKEEALLGARVNAVVEYHTKDVTVTDEEVRSRYDERLAEDREVYGEDPTAYADDLQNGTIIAFVPEGFRRVKHILVLLSEEDQGTMYTLSNRLEEIEEELKAEDADTEGLESEKAEITAQMDEIMAAIEPKVKEIQEKLAGGEDFLELMAEYGEDPGMEMEPYAAEGYLVHALSEEWVPAFRDGAMALEKPGDVSEPVRTPYGLHLIRYEEEVRGGAVPLEELVDTIRSELLTEKREEAYSQLTERLNAEADVTLYLDNFDAAGEEDAGDGDAQDGEK